MNPFQDFMRQVTPVPHCNSGLNYEACKKCSENGLVCCQRLPCTISPGEIRDLSFQGICNLIDTGLVSIDWWVGDVSEERGDFFTLEDILFGKPKNTTAKGFFLRMRGQGDPIVHPALLPSTCIAWERNGGCRFPYIYRPKGGRSLLPPNCEDNPTDECKETYSKLMGARDWLPYKDILQEAYDKYCTEADEHKQMFHEMNKLFTAKGESRRAIMDFLGV